MSPRPSRYAVAAPLLVGGLTACGEVQSGTGSGSSGSGGSGDGATSTTTTSSLTPTGSTPPATLPATGRVLVTGVPQAGVEASCLVLDRYLLVGGTPPHRALLDAAMTAGTTVTVTGHTDTTQASYCQQGTILVVDDVRAGT